MAELPRRVIHTVVEAATLLGFSKSTPHELIARGELDVVRLGPVLSSLPPSDQPPCTASDTIFKTKTAHPRSANSAGPSCVWPREVSAWHQPEYRTGPPKPPAT